MLCCMWYVMCFMRGRHTERRTGKPNFRETEDVAGEHEVVETGVATGNYMAVCVRYTVPTSDRLQETVALLSPTQPLADAFRFIAAVTRPPTQLACWAGSTRGGGGARLAAAELEPAHVARRDALREAAIDRAAECDIPCRQAASSSQGLLLWSDTPLSRCIISCAVHMGPMHLIDIQHKHHPASVGAITCCHF